MVLCFVSYSQVGIGTLNPNASLDIRSSNQTTPTNTDGILIPKIDNFPTVTPTANQDGMLVYATGDGTANKGFYYWDNSLTSWVPLTTTGGGGSGNTLDQAYDQGGNGLGKNINATNGAVRINGTDGFLVTGEVFYGNPIDTEITGAGTRMFFNPLMSAFRAGTIYDFPPLTGDEWDVSNTGIYSTAFGLNTMASGQNSTAFGSITTASGGTATTFGSNTTASGSISTALGSSTTASGDVSTAFGVSTLASGNFSTAFGNATIASETYAIAFGLASEASGVTSTAFGNQTNAIGFRSTAFGSLTMATGNVSTAFGLQSEASGQNSTAFGDNSEASGYASTAFGRLTEASGFGSTALGVGTIAPSSYETVLGMYNTTYTPLVIGNGFNLQDRLFVVGNGFDNVNRSDALVIYKNGIISLTDNVGIGTDTPTANLSVNGTANKPGGGSWAVFSDERLKENVSSYTEGLGLITKVRPVNFTYNNQLKKLLGENQSLERRIYQGVIAQELQQIAPDMVNEITINSETFLEVDPNKFTYALINSIQEQQHIIEAQNTKIKNIEAKMKLQQEEIEAIKAYLKKFD